MSYLIGLVLSVSVAAFARVAGLDRERAFYPTVLVVIASYYVLFAVMVQSTRAVLLEYAVLSLFVMVAVAGLRASAWVIVGALAGHGLFDAVHPTLFANAGVPPWWPAFCLAFDCGAAACLAMLLLRPAVRVAA